MAQRDEALRRLAEWQAAGKIHFKEDVLDGIERVPEAENAPESFNFSIANSDGLVIQEVDNNLAKKNGFADMKDLFDRARRRAVDLNGALDDLLSELDELSSQKS